MIKFNSFKINIFLRSIYHGIIGIWLEILLTLVFIGAGFVVSLAWWGFLK